MTDVTYDAAVIVRDQTRLATAPTEIEPGLFIVVDTNGDHQLIDARDQIQRTKDHPRRKTGSVTLAQHDSFTDYLAKHALTETEVWADINKDSITAVINAHSGTTGDTGEGFTEGIAGWGDHHATLQLVTTQDWRDWTGNNGKLVGQQEFAEFVEQHLPNFLRPSAADMLELAQTIKGHTKVSFESSKRVKSGETAIEWR